MKVFIGCSGYSYEDWVGTFYPADIQKNNMIKYYERFFEVVEVNYTYYSYPYARTVKSMIQRTHSLKFFFKLHSDFTHRRQYSQDDVLKFKRGIEPAMYEGRLSGILVQFPESFHFSRESMDYISSLKNEFNEFRIAIEVRHKSFKNEEFYNFIRGIDNITLVNVDGPNVGNLFIGPWMSFGSWDYVRLHGRNKQKWYKHEHAWERYDYLYTDDELNQIAENVKMFQSEEVYIFFNNHYSGKGPKNALKLMKILHA